MIKNQVLAAVALAALAAPAMAQTTVNSTNKFAWGENVGWINFRDANNGVQGVRFTTGSFLSGFAWGENIGYINFGDGTPTNGVSYANVNGNDAGVNYDAGTDKVTGLAWGENVGWINFTLPTLPANQQATYDSANRRLRGYAWGENIGWINLDVAVGGQFVSFDVACSPCDIADDAGDLLPTAGVNSGVNEGDYNAFFQGFFSAIPQCDIADDAGTALPPWDVPLASNNGVNEGDYNCFFQYFFLGCL